MNKINSLKSLYFAICLLAIGIMAIVGCTVRSGTVTPPSEFPAPVNLDTGGTLRLSLLTEPEHLDPHNSIAPGVLNWAAGLVYSRLFRFKADTVNLVGNTYTLDKRIECDLCQSWRQINNDTFEVSLRTNAVWQNVPPLNGRKVTAADVVASYERQAQVTNVNSFLLQNFEAFSVVNQQTLRFKLIQPDAEVFEKLAHAGSSIIPPELYAAGTLFTPSNDAIGSGPWILESSAGLYMLRSNPDYYEFDSAGNRLPYIDNLLIQFLDDPPTQSNSVLFGLSDIAYIEPNMLSEVQTSRQEFNILAALDHGNGVEVLLNTANANLADLSVRQALLFSWNINDWVTQSWGPNAITTAGLPAAGGNWYNPQLFANKFNNIQAANDLLNQVGFNSTTPIVITVGDFGDEYIQLAEMMVQALTNIGVAAQLRIVNTRDFGERVWLEGDFEIAVGATAPVFSLSDKLLTFYHSNGPLNTTSYSNKTLDDLIEQQSSVYEPMNRRQIFESIEEMVVAGSHRFNATANVNYWLSAACVNNFLPNTSGSNSFFLTRVWLDNGMCSVR